MAIIACKRILLALLVLTTWVHLSNRRAGAQTSAPKVIILNCLHPGFTRSAEEVSGMAARLQPPYPAIVPASEYLDPKRFSSLQPLARLKNFTRQKASSATAPYPFMICISPWFGERYQW